MIIKMSFLYLSDDDESRWQWEIYTGYKNLLGELSLNSYIIDRKRCSLLPLLPSLVTQTALICSPY